MADSNITKRALATGMKELMREMPFSKISVSDICKKCDMNRKSFYYHFKDKYDLVNWIYDTEFIAVARHKHYKNTYEFIYDLCCYFYENRDFYRRALQVTGQNSFSEHFRELLLPIIENNLKEIMGDQEVTDFHINFFADACMCAFERWLLSKDCMPAKEFYDLLRSCLGYTAIKHRDQLST